SHRPAIGVVAGPATDPTAFDPAAFGPVEAVRGPYPPPSPLVEWCAAHRVPYLAPDPAILADPRLAAGPGRGPLAVALIGARTPAEAGSRFKEAATAGGFPEAGPVTPPGAGPG
ncbi:MAG: hypothetical protein KGQ66_17895, partial [Acidobacteriota bacterium]|nr:hypothetical protein [Acidobacteriota bacterium]